MTTFMQQMDNSVVLARTLCDNLKTARPQLPTGIVINDPRGGGWCFTVKFNEGRGLSIATPPMGCATMETALWGGPANDTIIYDDDIGYDDVCLFDNANEIIEEINRVYALIG